jgi:hypothetical protein
MGPAPRSNRKSEPVAQLSRLVPKVLPKGQSVEVWIFEDDIPLRRVGSLRSALIYDARHHGQDLLDELVGRTLKEIERWPAQA